VILYYTDLYEFPLPPGHRFPLQKFRWVRELLVKDGTWAFAPAPPADAAVIELAHDRDYVRQFLEGRLPREAMRRIGFPWSEALVRRTLASVGGTLAAARDALAAGFGGSLAGGTHHACHAQGAGFCVFNDIAVAIHWARTEAAIRRAAVVDLDVHQGDGTALIFHGDPAVLTISVHGQNNFPFHKQQSDVDVELADGCGDEEYLQALAPLWRQVRAFAPDILFYQAGVDAQAGDRFGRLALTQDGLKRRDRLVLETCREAGIPVAVILGGGYGARLQDTAEAHANTYRVAWELFGTTPEIRNRKSR
jgi:acetoin utilization deacetylase AcuC-like enzyme